MKNCLLIFLLFLSCALCSTEYDKIKINLENWQFIGSYQNGWQEIIVDLNIKTKKFRFFFPFDNLIIHKKLNNNNPDYYIYKFITYYENSHKLREFHLLFNQKKLRWEKPNNFNPPDIGALSKLYGENLLLKNTP